MRYAYFNIVYSQHVVILVGLIDISNDITIFGYKPNFNQVCPNGA